MTDWTTAGRRIATLRKAAKMRQDDLAAALEVSRSAIAGIESGGDAAGLRLAVAIADYFKVPLDWLLCRTPPPGGPLVGDFVDEADELAWLGFWRDMDAAERSGVLSFLRRRDRQSG